MRILVGFFGGACMALAAVVGLQWQGNPLGQPTAPERIQAIVPPVDLSSLDPAIRAAFEQGRTAALQQARTRLDGLHAELMERVDGPFFDWYFGYWNQQALALRYAMVRGRDVARNLLTGSDANTAREGLLAEIGRQFRHRVMPEPILEQRLEEIAREAATVFLSSVRLHLADLAVQYRVPPAAFDRHLAGIAIMTADAEGSRSAPLTLKALVGGTVLAGGRWVSAEAALVPLVRQSFARFASLAAPSAALASAAAHASARSVVAGTSAARAAGAAGGIWGGPVTLAVVGGLVAWEAWDHRATLADQKPLLRASIEASLRNFEAGLLEPTGAIGRVVHSLQLEGLGRASRS